VVVDRAIALRGRAVVVVDRQNRESWSWIVVVKADFLDRGRGSWSLCPRITTGLAKNCDIAQWTSEKS